MYTFFFSRIFFFFLTILNYCMWEKYHFSNAKNSLAQVLVKYFIKKVFHWKVPGHVLNASSLYLTHNLCNFCQLTRKTHMFFLHLIHVPNTVSVLPHIWLLDIIFTLPEIDYYYRVYDWEFKKTESDQWLNSL